MVIGGHLKYLHTNACNARSKPKELGICAQLQSSDSRNVEPWLAWLQCCMDGHRLFGYCSCACAQRRAKGVSKRCRDGRAEFQPSESAERWIMFLEGHAMVFGMSGDWNSFLETEKDKHCRMERNLSQDLSGTFH